MPPGRVAGSARQDSPVAACQDACRSHSRQAECALPAHLSRAAAGTRAPFPPQSRSLRRKGSALARMLTLASTERSTRGASCRGP